MVEDTWEVGFEDGSIELWELRCVNWVEVVQVYINQFEIALYKFSPCKYQRFKSIVRVKKSLHI